MLILTVACMVLCVAFRGEVKISSEARSWRPLLMMVMSEAVVIKSYFHVYVKKD